MKFRPVHLRAFLCLLFISSLGRLAHAQTQALTGSLITPRLAHSATLLSNGSVLVAGGQNYLNSGTLLTSAELYSPQTGKFTSTGSLNAPRWSHNGVLLHDGTVLIYGGTVEYPGTDIGVAATTAEIYNPTAGTFTAVNSPAGLTSPVVLPSAQVLFFIQTTEYAATLELYNPSTRTFTSTGISTPVENMTLLPNGTVLITQGTSTYATVSAENFDAPAQIYNPTTNTLTKTGSETGTYANPAILLSNGTVLLGNDYIWAPHSCTGQRGVCNPYVGAITANQQIYNPSTGTFTLSQSTLPGAPWIMMNDGNIFSYSAPKANPYGCSPYDPLQIYNSTTEATITPCTLSVHDGSASVTALQSGELLIAGGVGAGLNSATGVAELYGDAGVTGIIHPKYIVVGVTYAPPGPQSYVSYTNSTTIGTNSTITNSFSSAESLSITIGSSAGVSGWVSGSVTGNSTTSFTQMQSNSDSVTLSTQGSLNFKTAGTPNAYSPVTHDYDIIWLWLNPIVILTANPNNPDALTWNGYGFDAEDQPVLDIWPIYVGYLNGDFGPMDPQDAKVLSRAWSTGQTFPKAGESPALNSTDYTQILTYDPFTNPKYGVVLSGTYGETNTTTDGRFTLSGGPAGQSQSFPYKQAAVGSTPIGVTYTNTYTNINALGSTATDTTQQAFSVDEKFNSGFFFASVTYELKETGTLTWTAQTQNTITTTQVTTDTLYIQGPPCTGSPCNPGYVSPAEFDVYQDNLYGTFMFNPETY